MAQPDWQLVANLGDANPVNHGGYFVYVDKTGVYPPEAEYLDAPDNDDGTWYAYRVVLERCTFVNGVPSDNPFDPDYPVWFTDRLDGIASTVGRNATELREDLCSDDPLRLAHAYRDIASVWGWEEFDSDPLALTRAEAETRYNKEN